MKTYTIYEIKYLTQDTQPHYFTRSSMKFFHQTMRDFKVKYSPSGRCFIYAIRPFGYSIREFTKNEAGQFTLNCVQDSYNLDTESKIKSYINSL